MVQKLSAADKVLFLRRVAETTVEDALSREDAAAILEICRAACEREAAAEENESEG